jgi:hypothetical protein
MTQETLKIGEGSWKRSSVKTISVDVGMKLRVCDCPLVSMMTLRRINNRDWSVNVAKSLTLSSIVYVSRLQKLKNKGGLAVLRLPWFL